MENDKIYIRRTISISPQIDASIEELSRDEFGGNASAFVAHSILQYIKCRQCMMQDGKSKLEELLFKESRKEKHEPSVKRKSFLA